MKTRWKILSGLALALVIGGTYVYQNRVDIILKRVASKGKPEVGPTINIDWAQGPAQKADEDGPPNDRHAKLQRGDGDGTGIRSCGLPLVRWVV